MPPPLRTTAGKLLVEDALPAGVAPDGVGALDKKGVAELYARLAALGPDVYRDVTHKLQQVGGRAGMESGGYSFGPEALAADDGVRAARDRIRRHVASVLAAEHASPDARDAAVLDAVDAGRPGLDAAMKGLAAAGSPLAKQALSGAKGSVGNLQSLVAGDLLYADSQFRKIPFPVLSGYAEGLDPHEWFANTFGARQGIVELKKGTASAGYWAKRARNAAHRLVVTAMDEEEDEASPHPGGTTRTPRGYPTKTTDADNEGALLAHPAGGYPRNTVLHRHVLEDLHKKGVEDILVRSPTVGGPADGGVYARDVGFRERGTLAPLGDRIGLAASNAIAEPVTQTTISSKHSGGVVGATQGQQGFPVLDQLISVPSGYPNGVVYARGDGTVDSVEPAPQGGTFVRVGDETHYVAPGRAVTAKPGDRVEAGDELSDGLENPQEITRHRGIGEGRRRFVDAFMAAAGRAGFRPHRRNVEVMARGLVNHVEMTDEYGDHSPGDVVPYSSLEPTWVPRPGATSDSPSSAVGRYLESPVLHHTIGTRVTRRAAKELEKWGVDEVLTHAEPPPFEARMIRSHDAAGSDPDWMVRFLGSNLHKTIPNAAHTGSVSDPAGTSHVPALAQGGAKLPPLKPWGPPPAKPAV